MQKPIFFCLLVGLFVPLSHAKLLMFDDFEGKLQKKYWHGQETWKTKNGVLEIEQPKCDGNCATDFGYGTVEAESFSLQFDFQLLQDEFGSGSSMDLLFRANELRFYQLIVTPADGV